MVLFEVLATGLVDLEIEALVVGLDLEMLLDFLLVFLIGFRFDEEIAFLFDIDVVFCVFICDIMQ